MNNITAFTKTLAAVLALSFCALAPLTAAGADDKKPLASAPKMNAEYRLGPGDKLRIEVYKDAQLSQSLQVRPDGKITLPLVGDIEATGRTPIEMRDTITKSLKEYVTNPTVTVIVVEATTPLAYVMGEVNHPGAVNMQSSLTIIQALALAGGLKDFADPKNIQVLRQTPSGVQAIAFNYKEALKSPKAQVYLQPGDTVVVP